MSEMEILISAFVGGSLAASAVAIAFLGHIKWCYDEKIKTLQYQLIALRSEMSVGYVE